MQEFSSVTASSYDADALTPLLSEKSAEGWDVISIVSAGTNIVAYLSREASDMGDAVVVESVDDAIDVDSAAAEPTGTENWSADATPITADVVSDVSAVDEPAGWGSEPEPEAVPEPMESVEDLAAQISEPETPAEPVAEPAPYIAAANEPVAEPAPYIAAVAEPVAEPAPYIAAAEPVVAEPVAEAAPYIPTAEPTAAEPTAVQPVSEPAPAESTVPAGWYADPSGRYELRYWDGTAWTEHVSRAGQQFTDPPVA